MEPSESHSSGAPIPHSKPPQVPITTHMAINIPTTASSQPSVIIRAPNSNRTVPINQKADPQARSSSSMAQSATEYREHKGLKDSSRSDEMSEYVHQGIDPTVPIYEITHALPDALILKCADCQRFARGTSPLLSHSHTFETSCGHGRWKTARRDSGEVGWAAWVSLSRPRPHAGPIAAPVCPSVSVPLPLSIRNTWSASHRLHFACYSVVSLGSNDAIGSVSFRAP